MKELLEAAGEQKLLMLNTDSGRVSLHIAAELVHVDVVNVLLAYVAAQSALLRVSQPTPEGATPTAEELDEGYGDVRRKLDI